MLEPESEHNAQSARAGWVSNQGMLDAIAVLPSLPSPRERDTTDHRNRDKLYNLPPASGETHDPSSLNLAVH